VSHRTVRCASGATTTSRATVDCNAFNARLRAEDRARAVGAPCLVHRSGDSLQDLSGAPPDSQRPHLLELQRSNPNGLLTWLAHRTVSDGASDCPVRHATTTFQRPHFGGWGYKYPNHPTFNCIQVLHLQHITRAIAFNSRHNQRDQILSQVRNHSKSNSD
jgi:hypothetical protein